MEGEGARLDGSRAAVGGVRAWSL